MCGISGFVDFRGQSSEAILEDMTGALIHRGPNDKGCLLTVDRNNAQIGLGHRRLSILDLSSGGHQPMVFENLVMVFNGEIYNFEEVRSELELLGYGFNSGSDSEVALKALKEWGYNAVHKFNGMFAIAIYDKKKNKLSLIRDRAGVKPLYWYYSGGLFLFSSELKSFYKHPQFKKELDEGGLALFLRYGYVPEPHSIFKNAQKLKAGYILEFELSSKKVNCCQYWNVEDYYNKPKLDISYQEAFSETEKLLISAFNYRMVADVPVGVFLSGGYDSTAVASILQSGRADKVKTYTIGFNEEKYNEAQHAKRVANYIGTEHTEYYCTEREALDILPRLPEIWDEPFGDASAIPTVLVSQLACKDVSVSLSADGGDELFAGYSKYTGVKKKAAFFGKVPRQIKPCAEKLLRNRSMQKIAELSGMHNAADRLSRFSLMLNSEEQSLLNISSQTFTQLDLDMLLRRPSIDLQTNFECDIDKDWLTNVLCTDYKTYMLDDILVKVDRATMSVGLEGREPLLDFRLIEYVAQLPSAFKLNGEVKKCLLKDIVHKYVPQNLMERPKMGFGVPIFEWFKGDLRSYLMTYLDYFRIANEGIFNPDYVVDLRDRYLAGDQTNINKIWYLLMFEMWKEKWM